RGEGGVGQPLEAHPEDGLAHRQEALIALDVARRELAHLAAHRLWVAGVVEDRPVMKADTIEGPDRTEVDLVGEAAAREAKELLEREGRGDHRGPGVIRVALLAVNERPPARRVLALDHLHPIAAHQEAHRRREPPKAAADHDRPRTRKR